MSLDETAAKAPNVYDAEPIPDAARLAIEAMLSSGDLFRYTAAKDAPVALLEAEFAALMGSKYALAVASCSAALFLALKALDLPPGARVLIPAFTFAAVPSACACRLRAGSGGGWRELPGGYGGFCGEVGE